MGVRADLDHYRKGALRVKISRLLPHATLKRQNGIKVRVTALHAGDLSWGSRTNAGPTLLLLLLLLPPNVANDWRAPLASKFHRMGCAMGFADRRGEMEGIDSPPMGGVLEEVGA